jgi:hypothetical protein
MNKDFNVKSFVEEYEKQSTDADKAKFLRSKLKTEKYMPYAGKLAIAENIVKSSSYAMVKEDGELKQTDRIALNSPMRYILFVMTVVDKYTNIEVNFKIIMPDFDALNFNSLIEVVFEKVGDKETAEFNTVVDMVLNDFMANKYQFRNYISDTLSRFSGLVEKCAPLIENITSKLDSMSEEDMEKLSGLIGKATKFIK